MIGCMGRRDEFSNETSGVVGILFNVYLLRNAILSFSFNHTRLYKPLYSQRPHEVNGATGFGPWVLAYQHLITSIFICYSVRKGKLSLRRMEKLPKIPLALLPCGSLLGVSAGLKPIQKAFARYLLG